jgi:hypothetical protein
MDRIFCFSIFRMKMLKTIRLRGDKAHAFRMFRDSGYMGVKEQETWCPVRSRSVSLEERPARREAEGGQGVVCRGFVFLEARFVLTGSNLNPIF